MIYYFIRNNNYKVIHKLQAKNKYEAKNKFINDFSNQQFKNIRIINEHQYNEEIKTIKEYKEAIR